MTCRPLRNWNIGSAISITRSANPATPCAISIALSPGPRTSATIASIARIHGSLGQAKRRGCDYDRSLALLDEAISHKRRRRTSSRPAVGFACTLACKGAVLGDRGEFARAYACFDEALQSVEGHGHEVEGSILCL